MTNERAFEHLVASLHNPQTSQRNQEQLNKERFDAVLNALKQRPHYLSVRVALPANAQNLPVSQSTGELKFDCIITGAITDGTDKKINFRRDTENGKQFVSVGSANTQLSLEAIAGKSLESAGTNGIQPLSPFILRAGEGLTVEIFRPVDAPAEVVTVVFCGYRVFTAAYANEGFTDKIRREVLNAINQTETPEPRFAAIPVKFNAGGNATAETPKTSEPRLVYGFRSTFQNALVNFGFDSNSIFSKDFFPIWAMAAESGNNTENYRMLKTPLFIEPQQQLYFNFKNTIDGVNLAANGQIEPLETTV
jgi:hypothetical protein